MYLTLKKILRASSILESVERRLSESEKLTKEKAKELKFAVKDFTAVERSDFVETFISIKDFNLEQIEAATSLFFTLYKQEITRQNLYIKDINESLNEAGDKGATSQTLSETILNIILNLAQINIYQYENLTLVDYRKIVYYQGKRIQELKNG